MNSGGWDLTHANPLMKSKAVAMQPQSKDFAQKNS
jgi:hypothetical protein